MAKGRVYVAGQLLGVAEHAIVSGAPQCLRLDGAGARYDYPLST